MPSYTSSHGFVSPWLSTTSAGGFRPPRSSTSLVAASLTASLSAVRTTPKSCCASPRLDFRRGTLPATMSDQIVAAERDLLFISLATAGLIAAILLHLCQEMTVRHVDDAALRPSTRVDFDF